MSADEDTAADSELCGGRRGLQRQSASGGGVPAGWLDFGRGGVRDARVASEAGLLKSVLKLVAWPLDTSHLVATVKMAWG